jgi:hypothetical protein
LDEYSPIQTFVNGILPTFASLIHLHNIEKHEEGWDGIFRRYNLHEEFDVQKKFRGMIQLFRPELLISRR